jgi:hypothetical protein
MQTPTNNKVSNNEDLISILEQVTSKKDIPINNESATEVDFEAVNENDFQAEKIEMENNINEDPVTETKTKTKKEWQTQAQMVIAFADGISALTFPALYEKSIFSKDEKKKLLEWKKKGLPESLTDIDRELIERQKDYTELVKSVPLSNEEVQLIETPLANVFEKYDINLGPEILLIGAIFTVFAPRVMPLFYSIEKKL